MSHMPRPDSYWQHRIHADGQPGKQGASDADGIEQRFSLLDYYRSIRDQLSGESGDRDSQ